MADQENRPSSVQEEEEHEEKTVSRPPSRPMSARSGSKAGSRPTSTRPGSKQETQDALTTDRKSISPAGSARGSVKDEGSHPASAKSSRPGTAQGSKPGSAIGSRPGSVKLSRPGSAVKSPKQAVFEEPGSPDSQRPESRKSLGSRPQSAARAVSAGQKDDDDFPEYEEEKVEGEEEGEGEEGDEDPFPSLSVMPIISDLMLTQQPEIPVAGSGGGGGGGGDDGEGDGGEGGGGDSDGGSGDEEEDEGEMSDEEGSEAEAGDMVVLDPDHPLMKRFQTALKAHLSKQDEKFSLELREMEEGVKNRKKEREDLGVELYGIQQELARYQMNLEKHHDEFAEVQQIYRQEEQQLADVRSMYKETQYTINQEKKKTSELQAEVENLALRLFYMQSAKEDVRSDIAIMKRAAEKADNEVARAETEKQRQDLFVDRLVERVDKLKEEIAMFEAQITAQLEETKAAKEALMEAHMEIEAISLEKKQLYQQWNSSLIGMRRRDEAHSAMMEALSQQQQKVQSLETEIEGYKKSIQKEQEQNEKLTLILNKAERDIETIKKQLALCQSKHDAQKAEYATYTRMLHETEQALNRAMTDKTLRMNELNALRKQIEREYLEKVQLEDDIMEKIRSQLTMDKAAHYTKKLTSKKRDLTKKLETQMAEVENQISQDTLEISNVRARIERLEKIVIQLNNEIASRNEIISKSENEIVKRNAIIERKQNVIDQYNKKLEYMISKAGGVELGPLEIEINSLQKSIDAQLQDIGELQQLWLRQQSELVRLSKEKEEQSKDVQSLKKQLTILLQKKARTEGDIDGERRETYDIERSIRNMQNDMIKLNTLLYKERGVEVGLQQDNILKENEFVVRLKDAELESIEMQEKLDFLREEKERLLNSLVEAERQIMLWEKKTQLARETRAAVDSEVGQGEVKAMKAEIHRMQVRYAQLMKQQEKMIQEMEKAVTRRDTIVTRGDAQQKINKKVLTKGTFERQMAETRKKIKQTIQEANGCDTEIQELRQHQQEMSQQLEQRQINVQHLQSSSDTLDGDIDRLVEVKQKNLTELSYKQQKMKYFQQVRDGKYVRLCKSSASLENEYKKQVDRMQALNTIVDRLNQEFSHAQPAMRRATMLLSTRALPNEEEQM